MRLLLSCSVLRQHPPRRCFINDQPLPFRPGDAHRKETPIRAEIDEALFGAQLTVGTDSKRRCDRTGPSVHVSRSPLARGVSSVDTRLHLVRRLARSARNSRGWVFGYDATSQGQLRT